MGKTTLVKHIALEIISQAAVASAFPVAESGDTNAQYVFQELLEKEMISIFKPHWTAPRSMLQHIDHAALSTTESSSPTALSHPIGSPSASPRAVYYDSGMTRRRSTAGNSGQLLAIKQSFVTVSGGSNPTVTNATVDVEDALHSLGIPEVESSDTSEEEDDVVTHGTTVNHSFGQPKGGAAESRTFGHCPYKFRVLFTAMYQNAVCGMRWSHCCDS